MKGTRPHPHRQGPAARQGAGRRGDRPGFLPGPRHRRPGEGPGQPRGRRAPGRAPGRPAVPPDARPRRVLLPQAVPRSKPEDPGRRVGHSGPPGRP
ncbi:MAG: hypothetical protein M0C28_05470 [Candidatus Moduliflexus flocculans]|nr:hypothetical protein [Candidatus Moduliflexus flocculans]